MMRPIGSDDDDIIDQTRKPDVLLPRLSELWGARPSRSCNRKRPDDSGATTVMRKKRFENA